MSREAGAQSASAEHARVQYIPVAVPMQGWGRFEVAQTALMADPLMRQKVPLQAPPQVRPSSISLPVLPPVFASPPLLVEELLAPPLFDVPPVIALPPVEVALPPEEIALPPLEVVPPPIGRALPPVEMTPPLDTDPP
jgi:hypothetical protein